MSIYYGIDSNTDSFPTGAKSKDFYIGCLGHKTTADTDDWSTIGAGKATHVYGYWFLHGPKDDPLYTTSYTTTDALNWGEQQGASALVVRQNKSACNGYTIFSDAECTYPYSYGWLVTTTTSSGKTVYATNTNSTYVSLNYAVFKGFVVYINQYHLSGWYSGSYTSSGPWHDIMGTSTSYTPGYADVFWGASWLSSTTPPTSMSSAPTVNGSAATIWQYYGNQADYDIASKLPS